MQLEERQTGLQAATSVAEPLTASAANLDGAATAPHLYPAAGSISTATPAIQPAPPAPLPPAPPVLQPAPPGAQSANAAQPAPLDASPLAPLVPQPALQAPRPADPATERDAWRDRDLADVNWVSIKRCMASLAVPCNIRASCWPTAPQQVIKQGVHCRSKYRIGLNRATLTSPNGKSTQSSTISCAPTANSSSAMWVSGTGIKTQPMQTGIAGRTDACKQVQQYKECSF